jgi:hypothetical protein
MKTIQNIHTKEIRRVSDERANDMVDGFGALDEKSGIFWSFIKKEVWKKEARDPAKSIVKAEVVAPVSADAENERLRKIDSRKQKKEYQKQRRVRTNN